MVTADPTSERVAYFTDGTLFEVDVGGGAPARTVPDVFAASYTSGGLLVVVGTDGGVRWLPAE